MRVKIKEEFWSFYQLGFDVNSDFEVAEISEDSKFYLLDNGWRVFECHAIVLREPDKLDIHEDEEPKLTYDATKKEFKFESPFPMDTEPKSEGHKRYGEQIGRIELERSYQRESDQNKVSDLVKRVVPDKSSNEEEKKVITWSESTHEDENGIKWTVRNIDLKEDKALNQVVDDVFDKFNKDELPEQQNWPPNMLGNWKRYYLGIDPFEKSGKVVVPDKLSESAFDEKMLMNAISKLDSQKLHKDISSTILSVLAKNENINQLSGRELLSLVGEIADEVVKDIESYKLNSK